MALTIISNKVPRETLNKEELTEKEAEEFDYDIDSSGLYFRYKDQVYSDQEFTSTHGYFNSDLVWWDGIQHDTFFSGVLVKFSRDCEEVIVGRYYS